MECSQHHQGQQDQQGQRQSKGDCNQGAYDKRSQRFGNDRITIGHRQRFPEQDAAVLALVVKGGPAVEEHHEAEGEHQRHGHGRVADSQSLGELDLLRIGYVVEGLLQVDGGIVAIQMEAALAACRGRKQHGTDGQQSQKPGNHHRRPEEAAFVFPVLAFQKPFHRVHA